MDKLLWRISLSETGEQQFKVSIIGPDEMAIAYSDSPQAAYDSAVAKLVVKPWLVNDKEPSTRLTDVYPNGYPDDSCVTRNKP